MDLFTNSNIDIQTLPRIEEANWQPLQKSFLHRQLVGFAITQGIVFLGALIYISFSAMWLEFQILLPALGIWALFMLVRILIITKGFKKKAYALRERDLLYRTGLLWRSMSVVPFNRVQHASIQEGVVDKMFELSSLRVFTAGTSGSDMVIPGLDLDTAQRIKDFIIKRTSLDE